MHISDHLSVSGPAMASSTLIPVSANMQYERLFSPSSESSSISLFRASISRVPDGIYWGVKVRERIRVRTLGGYGYGCIIYIY